MLITLSHMERKTRWVTQRETCRVLKPTWLGALYVLQSGAYRVDSGKKKIHVRLSRLVRPAGQSSPTQPPPGYHQQHYHPTFHHYNWVCISKKVAAPLILTRADCDDKSDFALYTNAGSVPLTRVLGAPLGPGVCHTPGLGARLLGQALATGGGFVLRGGEGMGRWGWTPGSPPIFMPSVSAQTQEKNRWLT